MKKLPLLILFAAMLFFSTTMQAQTKEEKLDLPGDNLNLYAVLKLFQESETLEGFEKKLNEEGSQVNNLDLDGDDKTDYIKVLDNVDGDVHTIVLQVDVNENEKQDVAVFTVQKDADNKVQVQLIGDEELYGKDYIVEPNMEDVSVDTKSGETPNPGYIGNTTKINNQDVTITKTTTVVIGTWPVVRYMFLPSYVMWHSPWYWHYYPSYWHPWRPFFWHQYWGYHSHWNPWYYGHYRRWPYYRYNHWNDFYFNSRRARSPVFYNRRQTGFYKKTYTRPETRRDGDALFKKLNPNNRLLDSNRPVTRPTKPSIQPERPTTRPIVKPIPQKPAVRPITKPIQPRPVTRPAVQKPAKPAIRPSVKPVVRTRDLKKTK